MASVETYLKFAEAIGLTFPIRPASTNSGVNIAAINNMISNNIFSLGNGNFATDASGNFQNPFLNTSRRILQLGSNIITPEKLNSLLDYGNVVSFGYIIGTHIQPYSFSSVATYLKLAEAIGLTYRPQPTSAGDGVAIASLVDQ